MGRNKWPLWGVDLTSDGVGQGESLTDRLTHCGNEAFPYLLG